MYQYLDMDEIKNNYSDEIIESPDNGGESNVDLECDENVNFYSEEGEEEEEYSNPEEFAEADIVDKPHDHAPTEIEQPQPEEYDDEVIEENSNELDEEAINSFILQLFQLKKNNLLKKRE